MQMCVITLVQASNDLGFLPGFIGGGILAALVCVGIWTQKNKQRSGDQSVIEQRLKQAEQVAREQEEALNSLGAARAKAEIKLAELNAQIAQQEIERRKVLREFDEMNVQRMKMELTLCKLQIRSLERELGGADYFE